MTEHQLITPRRNFLIRALGFTAAGATVGIPVVLADSPQKRVDYHLRELTKALQEQFPLIPLVGGSRNVEAWQGITDPGDIVATVRAAGNMEYAADRYRTPAGFSFRQRRERVAK